MEFDKKFTDIDKEIERLLEEKRRLTDEQKRVLALPPDVRLAEALHVRFCTRLIGSFSECSWHYEKGVETHNERGVWLTRARHILSLTDGDEQKALAIINAIDGR